MSVERMRIMKNVRSYVVRRRGLGPTGVLGIMWVRALLSVCKGGFGSRAVMHLMFTISEEASEKIMWINNIILE